MTIKESDKQESKVVKSILPGMCPHCNKKILTSIRSLTPVIEWTLKEEDTDNAKNRIIEAIKSSKMPQAEIDSALTWIEDEGLIFGPEDVEGIIAQIVK